VGLRNGNRLVFEFVVAAAAAAAADAADRLTVEETRIHSAFRLRLVFSCYIFETIRIFVGPYVSCGAEARKQSPASAQLTTVLTLKQTKKGKRFRLQRARQR
jgi:hypothetical protein